MADPIDSEITAEPADMKAASPAETGNRSTPEITRPMLDVHAPHEPIHTWKNFFIHLATISIGLLIAIGLEQTVEAGSVFSALQVVVDLKIHPAAHIRLEEAS
jgi:hypothetical protein